MGHRWHDLPRAGYHGNYFYGGSASLPLVTGEKLFMYVLPNPCDPPREIMLEIYDGSNWNHRAYWGENLQPNGTDGTNSRRRLGDLPPLGVWTRLEIPAEQVGMAGSTVRGLAFGVYDGQVWFDRVGKTAAGSGMSQMIPTTMISSAGEDILETSQADAVAESQPAKGGFWRRLMRKILRRPETAPPVSFTVYAQFTPETNSTIEMKRHSLYTPELQLLAETSTSALTPWIANEYVWFNGEPVAQINRASGEVAYYFNDHLGAPILQTDATGAVVWHVERDPYGERYATRVGGERHQPLGLPGQEYDASSDRQYNIFRWYRAGWGRYTQADPGGLAGGINLFAYVNGRPTVATDPLGLVSSLQSPSLPPSYTRPGCTATPWESLGVTETTYPLEVKWVLFREQPVGIVGKTQDQDVGCICWYKYAGTIRPHSRTEQFKRSVTCNCGPTGPERASVTDEWDERVDVLLTPVGNQGKYYSKPAKITSGGCLCRPYLYTEF